MLMSVQYIGHKTGPCIKLGRKQMRNTDKYKKVVMRERMMNDKHDDNDESEGIVEAVMRSPDYRTVENREVYTTLLWTCH